MDESIRKAFSRVKEDISSLQFQIASILEEINEIKRTLTQTDKPADRPAHGPSVQTTPTQNQAYQAVKTQYSSFSTGNQGVPADRQTNQQTDQQPKKFVQSNSLSTQRVSEVIDSFDSLRADLLYKFKKFTPQEFLIFSTLYQLTEENSVVDYTLLAQKTSLTESSIRDYIQKLIKKGAPIEKSKENNKKIVLFVPEGFKKIASLSTIISLQDK